MNLIIDAGNTWVKLAIYNGESIVFHEQIEKNDFCDKIRNLFSIYPGIRHSIVSNVGGLDKKQLDVVSVFTGVHHLSHASKTPFKNSYATPTTLGVDRIALATAAFNHNPQGNTLVIGAGTCVTYDLVNDYGEYMGGAISPGLVMRYRALNQQTEKLPLLAPCDIDDFIGNSTETSIHSGVVNGICLEIDGVINQYSKRFADLTVILTGGDAQFLSKRLKNTIFANSNFLLEGLNYLLEYNKR